MCEERRFEAAILSFNIINHQARLEGLRAARRMNLGLATMNPLGGGLLARLNTYFDSDRGEYGEDFLATALRFVASHEEVSVILSGMKDVREVEQNVKALEAVEHPSREAVDAILEPLGGLGRNFCTLCRYCLPCPESIDIPAFMAAYDLHKAGMQSAGRQQLGFRRSKNRAETCSQCGECEEKCTQQLSIIERLKEIDGRFGKKY